jgi:hypothetical protein
MGAVRPPTTSPRRRRDVKPRRPVATRRAAVEAVARAPWVERPELLAAFARTELPSGRVEAELKLRHWPPRAGSRPFGGRRRRGSGTRRPRHACAATPGTLGRASAHRRSTSAAALAPGRTARTRASPRIDSRAKASRGRQRRGERLPDPLRPRQALQCRPFADELLQAHHPAAWVWRGVVVRPAEPMVADTHRLPSAASRATERQVGLLSEASADVGAFLRLQLSRAASAESTATMDGWGGAGEAGDGLGGHGACSRSRRFRDSRV